MARTKVRNARGHSGRFVAKAPTVGCLGCGGLATLIGSQSYNYTVPILSLAGRGGMDLNLNLYYNSRIMDVDTSASTITFNADRDFPSYGFRLDFGYIEYTSGDAILTEGDGTKRDLATGGSAFFTSTDGTNITLDLIGTNRLVYSNGTQVQYESFPSNSNFARPIWIKDANGNYISITYVSGHDQSIYQVTDARGRVITFMYDSSNRLTSLSQQLHASGSKTLVTFTWGTPYASSYTWYNFTGLTPNGFPTGAQFNALTGCTYPNGTGYRFTYGDWGIVNKIERLSSSSATQSYISYNYPLASAGALTDAPAYTQQTISPDGGSSNNSVWGYTTTKDSTGAVTSMAVTDPKGTVSTTNVAADTGLVSSVQIKDSSNTTLRTVNYTWASSGFSGATVPDTITTINDAGQQSKIQYGYDTYYGQTTDVYEYDFGLQLTRHTVTTYLNGANVNPSPHIFNLPTRVVVKDGSGNTIARTDMAYDSSSPTAVTGAVGHDDSGYSASLTTRGNLTSTTRYSNAAAGTGAVTRTFSYDSLGNMISAQLDCCNQKTFNFSSTTQYSVPDSIVRGPSGMQFTTSATYDFDTGLLLTSTDENGQITSYQYDSMNRTTRVTLPPQAGTSVQVNTAYDDAAASPTVTSSSTANSAVSIATLDGLGHVMRVDRKNGTTMVGSVTYAYDKLWEPNQASNPFLPSDTIVNTAFAYDGLGRVTRVTPPSGGYSQYLYYGNTVTVTDAGGKQRKNYSDALGRLIRVDEPGETFAGSPVNGTLTIGGTLRGQTGSGSPASGSVTIGGFEQSYDVDPCQDFGGSCPQTIWDTGTVAITVNGHTDSTSYSGGFTTSTPESIASGLASAINSDSAAFVTASASGSVISLTSKTAGTVGNGYSLTVTSSTNDSVDFLPSFSGSTSGSTLSGGIAGTTGYDSGTVNVTVGSFTASAPYSQSGNSTAAQLATALVGTGSTGLNRSSSPLIATASGVTTTLTYKAAGATGTDITATATSSTNDTTHFPGGSFSGSNTLTDGQNAYSSGLANPYATTYTYDVLDNLTAVSQAAGNIGGQPASGQSRSYAYDSMGRPTSAITPESGTVYTYYTDSSGNNCSGDMSSPCRVQDARGIVKTFTYDAINRPTGVSYSGSSAPSVSYTYDYGGSSAFAQDRLTKIIEGSNSQTFTYDNFGRLASVAQVVDSTTYTTSYTYTLASQLASITYPTGRVVAQNYDAIGRLCSVGAAGSTCTSGTTYLNSLTYNAAGETLGLTLGNNVQGSFAYNDHLQMSTLHYFKGTTDILDLGYDYGTNNNGQIQTVHYYTSPGVEDTTKSEAFTYDPWFRLSAAQTVSVSSSTAGTWKLNWSYDRFGNRLSQTLVDGNVSIGQPVFSVDPATNQITNTGYHYDAAGNLINDGASAYSYDGANRLTQIGSGAATYAYFGASRIKKVVGSNTTVYIYSGSKPIVEYVNGNLSKEYVYAGSQLVATLAGTTTTYHHPDHLSNRVETDGSGSVVRTFGHFPFGETWYEPLASDKGKFTTYENDSATGETGLNYAQFRYQSPGQGRFMNGDPMAGSLGVPQSLNRYSYTMNDPVNLIDPLGLESSGSAHYLFSGGCIIRAFYDSRGDGPDVMYDWEVEICTPGDEHDGIPGSDGGGGGSAKQVACTLNIKINNVGNLPKEQLTAIENQVASLFGDLVGVDFSGTQPTDETVNMQDPGWLAKLLGDDDGGHVDSKGNIYVHWGVISDEFQSQSQDTKNMIIGTHTAHELLHNLLHEHDIPYDKKEPHDIMTVDSSVHGAFDMVHNLLKLTKSEKEALLKECLKRRSGKH